MRIQTDGVWAGSEATYVAAEDSHKLKAQMMQAGTYGVSAGSKDDEDEDQPRLLSIEDGVATITIHGGLNNDSDSWWNEYVGAVGYPEIREALVAAASDPEVKEILLDISSGGGAVEGVADTANLIRLISDRVKPVTTFGDTMCSAAMWLGASAGKVYAGKASLVGSIGVLCVHKEMAEAYKQAGIGVNVIRAGSEKALANSHEKLSDKGRAQIQKVVDASYGVFIDHISAMRNVSYVVADQVMGQGKEFIGAEAVDVGLVDAINSFDQVMGLLKSKAIDSSNNFMDNRGKPNRSIIGQAGTNLSGEPDMGVKNKQALTEQDIAALAAGASALKVGEEIVAEAGGSVADAEAEAGKTAESAVSTEAAKEVVEAAVEKVANFDATIQLLNSQLAAKDEALLQAGIKLAKLEESAALVTASAGPLLEIVCKSINNMQVALNSPALDMSAMAPAQVLAEHGRWTAQFADKFKVGGVAAVTGEVSAKNEQAPLDAMAKARLDAVRFSR